MSYIDVLKELQNAKGSNAKKEILKANIDNEDFKNYLYLLFNPHYTYGVGTKSIKYAKNNPISEEEYSAKYNFNFMSLCEYLNNTVAVTNDMLSVIGRFLLNLSEEELPWIEQLLTKSVRLGVTSTTINKVIPDLIPTWEVQQAYKYEDGMLEEGTEFWLTQKLNGVRATFVDGRLYARSGEEYKGLESIVATLKTLSSLYNGLVFDGELTLIQDNNLNKVSDNEAFRIATGIINSDSDDKNGKIRFTVFDCLHEKEFYGEKTTNYRERRYFLDELALLIGGTVPDVKILPVLYHGTDQYSIDALLNRMVAEDKEGLMLNLNVPYQRKRHKGILKVKRFFTMDLKIVSVEEGTGKYENQLGAICVDFSGNTVKVGSGFTDYQREWMWEHRDELIGKIAEVKYKEISTNKTTELKSLQFPVFVQLREDKNEVSYN